MPTAFRIKNAKCSTAIGREQKAYWSTLSSRETVLTHARACCRRRYTPKVQGSKVLSRQARKSKNSIHIQPDSHLDVLSSTALLAFLHIQQLWIGQHSNKLPANRPWAPKNIFGGRQVNAMSLNRSGATIFSRRLRKLSRPEVESEAMRIATAASTATAAPSRAV